jgi:hypothetical protein
MERVALRAFLWTCACAGLAVAGCASSPGPAPPPEYDTMVASSAPSSSLPPVAFRMVPDSRTNTLYYVVTNRGSSAPVDVTFAYQAGAGAPAVAATPSTGDCGLTGAQVACTVTALAPGATQTIEVQLSPQPGQKIATNAHLQVASATGEQGTATLQPVLPAVSGSSSTTASEGGHFAQGLSLSPQLEGAGTVPPIAFAWGASADRVSLTATNTGDQAIAVSVTLTGFDRGIRVEHIQAVLRQVTPSRGEARWDPPASSSSPWSTGVVWTVTLAHCDSATLGLQRAPGAGGSVTFGGPFTTTPPPGGPNASTDPMRGSVAQPASISPAGSPPGCTGPVVLTGPPASGTVSRAAPSTTASPAAVPSPSGAASAPRTPGGSAPGSKGPKPSGRPSPSPSPSPSR